MKPLAANSLLQNRYLIIHHIGKGGMGEVYLAVDQRLGNPVALKRTVFRDDATMWDAFEREARILGRLRHSALPKVTDHFSETEEQYLVMDYISGDDLAKRLELSQKPFPLQWVLYWADELLDALHYLHTHEPPIIHRDIKPQNLKLTNENHIVLLDFGLAKNSVPQKKDSSSSGSLVGYTPNYAPIEQIRGTGTGPHSDIYSLSATLYQLLTATVPTDALTRAESVIGGSGDSLPSPTEIIPAIPAEISAVVLRGMALNSEQRYADAKEMQKALREAYSSMHQTAAQDGQETLVPEPKAAPPAGSVSGTSTQKEAFIFNGEDVDGMFKAAQDPPVTLTAEALEHDTAIFQPPEADFAATIPAEKWDAGETRGFTHDEIRRTTIDEEVFKKHGFDQDAVAQAAVEAAAAEHNEGFPHASPYVDVEAAVPQLMVQREPLSEFTAAGAAEPETMQWNQLDEKPTPIRPVTKPREPVQPSSGLGIKLVGIAAVLCFLVAAGGAFGWYAVSNKLIEIPGFAQGDDKKQAEPAKSDPADAKISTEPASDPRADDPGNTAGKEAEARADVNAANPERTDESKPAAERKPNQPQKQAGNPPAKADKTAKQGAGKPKSGRVDILQ